MTDFVHLHVHTQYSLLDGAIKIDSLFKKAEEFGMESVAITDHGVMYGVIDFYNHAKKAGIKHIIGCECYVAPKSLTDKTREGMTHLLLLAENQEGYKNLCFLSSIAHTQGFYYKPRIDKEILKEHSKGLIALSACIHGEIPIKILKGDIKGADESAHFYRDLFGENNFFLEVQNNGIPEQETVNEALFDMSGRLSIPLAATNDCHYMNKEDVHAHDVLLCIQTSKTLKDNDRLKFNTDQLYFKSKQEMISYFADHSDACDNTIEIAKRCNVEFDFKTYHFPRFELDKKDKSIEEFFKEEVTKGFENAFQKISAKNPDADKSIYEKRLDYEISVIIEMEFCGYFLIVADFIKHAKKSGVPVGPGRGSAAGSLAAYSLDITELDPLEHGLIFERFLNPDRKSMPDIDVDFCINGRDSIFKYVSEKYGGDDYVAHIITFGKLKTRAVIRDVGRALDIPLSEVDKIAKLVPDSPKITLEDALKEEPMLEEIKAESEINKELFEVCKTLEGLPRHASTHAAGVVISDKPLTEYMPLCRGKNGEIVTQFDMNDVEKIGLIKFDFLGLKNLTIIAAALDLIKSRGKEVPDILNLDLKDAKTYELLCKANTDGVFQLESAGMKNLMKKLKPSCFDDITALVALYRPGPMESGMIEDYVERKHGRKKMEYLLPQLEPILKPTYGVIVYQEQAMEISVRIAGYTMAEADILRKAMGKKIPEIMNMQRESFVNGAVKNGIDKNKAEKLFDLIDKFSGYGFNKSHSAAYALIAFQTAYLKANFSTEFMAALLTSEMQSTDNIAKYLAESRSQRINILPPDINEGYKSFSITDSGIRFGLAAVKNVGESAIEAIVEEREANGKFATIYDFCQRVDLHRINKRMIENLIKCGAFDSLGAKRSQNLAAMDEAVEWGQKMQKEKNSPQMSIFGSNQEEKIDTGIPSYKDIEEFSEKERLDFEKEALGFYISGHPIEIYKDILDRFTDADTANVAEKKSGSIVRIAGIVREVKQKTTKKGDRMAFVLLEDLTGSFEAVVFPKTYEASRNILIKDTPVIVQGKAEKDIRDEKKIKVIADAVVHVNEAEAAWPESIYLDIDISKTERDNISKLKSIFNEFPGNCSVYLRLGYENKVEALFKISDEIKVKNSPALFNEIKEVLDCAQHGSVR